jgi:DNA-binding transcriptional regulator YiaG
MREGREWSQKQLGEYLGVEQATVSRLENDQWAPSGPILKLLKQLESQPVSGAA